MPIFPEIINPLVVPPFGVLPFCALFDATQRLVRRIRNEDTFRKVEAYPDESFPEMIERRYFPRRRGGGAVLFPGGKRTTVTVSRSPLFFAQRVCLALVRLPASTRSQRAFRMEKASSFVSTSP